MPPYKKSILARVVSFVLLGPICAVYAQSARPRVAIPLGATASTGSSTVTLAGETSNVVTEDSAPSYSASAESPDEAPPSPNPSAAPAKVVVGVYVNQIYEMSLKENRIVVDFWLWFRWMGEDLKPYESFEVKNARIDSKGDPTIKQVNGENYAYLRVVANLTHFWDVSAYPFDDHSVKLEIEEVDNEQEKVVYIPDVEASGLSLDVNVLTFVPSAAPAVAATSKYRTNYGDPSLAATNETTYSKFSLPIHLKREGLSFFIKLFFGLFIATAIAFLAFFIKPTDLDPRFGLGIGAIFAAIASEYVVVGGLPDSAAITLADKLHILAFGAIFVSIAQSTWALHMFANGNEKRSKQGDRISAATFPLAYIVLNLVVVISR